MISILMLVAAVGLIEARPSLFPAFSNQMVPAAGSKIIGGVNANPGEFPWQLSQQRSNAAGAWSHSCGASLLSNLKALSAAHCIDGAAVNIIRVIAGLHTRSNTAGTQTSNAARLVKHENYNQGTATYANDIAIIHLSTSITTGSNIRFATLPASNNNNYAGTTCVLSGWGRTSSSNTLPDTLQKASIRVQSTAECRTAVGSIGTIWDSHLCLFDSAGNIGSCNGDSGGPCNCPDGGATVVAGVTSWGVSSALGNCLQTYPSVYTRTSTYLSWIASN